jgi:hypothetical protein
MVPHDTAHEVVEVIQAMVPVRCRHVATGTSTLGAPLAMDFSMTYGPPASHNENYMFSLGSIVPRRLINSCWTRPHAFLRRTSEVHIRLFEL